MNVLTSCWTTLVVALALLSMQAGCSDLLSLEPGELAPARCSLDEECNPEQTCKFGRCTSIACTPGARRCELLSRQRCGDDHRWHSVGSRCTERCVDGACEDARSCRFAALCGENSDVSCCESREVPGGTFLLPDDPPSERVDGPVTRTVSPFVLDRYEVTVGRFRNFLDAYDELGPPEPGKGAHPNIRGSGWQQEWNDRRLLPSVVASLAFPLTSCGQQIDGSVDDRMPVRCISWYLAFAFCIWDGGRLPTEAEWSFAAMGGDQQLIYPWSKSETDSSISSSEACYTGKGEETKSGPDNVGSHAAGAGVFEHEDLAGNLWEWIADGYLAELSRAPCRTGETSTREAVRDCEELDATDQRMLKGGSYVNDVDAVRNRLRSYARPTDRNLTFGFRCAR